MDTAVTPRHVVLTVAALAVLGLGVYLFVQVQETPASVTATAPPRPERPAPSPPPPAKEPAPGPTNMRPVRPIKAAPVVRRTEPEAAKPQLSGTEIKNLDATMSEANKAYDRGDFGEATEIAKKVLAEDPSNVRMLRIVVSASCIEGESVVAQQHYLKLPAADRQQMKVRCARYGVSFNES